MFVTGQILFQYAQKSLAIEVLCNPTLFTLNQCLKNILHSPTGQIQIIYAGATFFETGSWLLSDGTFSAYNFYELIDEIELTKKQNDLENINNLNKDIINDPCNGHLSIAEHLSSHDIIVYLHTEPAGEWAILQNIFSQHHIDTRSLKKSITSSLIFNDLNNRSSGSSNRSNINTNNRYNQKRTVSTVSTSKSNGQMIVDNIRRYLFHFELNPENEYINQLDTLPGKVTQNLLNFLGDQLAWHFEWLMKQSKKNYYGIERGNSLASIIYKQDPIDTVGFVRLQQPTMYIFPSGQGDCALLSLDSGFTMLLDAGYMSAPFTIWPFIKHLQRLDSIVVSFI